MKLVKLDKCPICSSPDIFEFRKGTFEYRNLSSSDFRITDSSYGSLWDFSQCNKCSFVFSNPQIDEGSLVEFYSALEDTEYSEESDGRAKNFMTILNRLKKMDKPDDSLLDIGSASGIFVKLALENGYRAEGIEPSAYLVREAKEKFGVNIFRGTVENFNPGHLYSVITLLDIIEHVHSPEQFIANISKFLKKNGILTLVTPDISSMVSHILGKRWWHYRIAHIHFFNKRSLKYLLSKNGFEIIKIKRYAWNFSLFYLVTRIFPSVKEKKSLKKYLKKINLKVQLFDSMEIYARKI